jgi:hypothetical protein
MELKSSKMSQPSSMMLKPEKIFHLSLLMSKPPLPIYKLPSQIVELDPTSLNQKSKISLNAFLISKA